jgi:hypothetical protein
MVLAWQFLLGYIETVISFLQEMSLKIEVEILGE